ncbi:hypothetical protein GCM10027446_07750 [Angustibacter peucedani]
MPSSTPSRRAVLQGAAGTAVVGLTAAACGGGDDGASGAGAAPATTGPIGAASQVPVGGGAVFVDSRVVVTQPTAGEFKAFSTRCPHQGCAVTQVTDGFIVCPCHDSRFAVATGEPTPDSPAKQALSSVAVTVQDGELVAG